MLRRRKLTVPPVKIRSCHTYANLQSNLKRPVAGDANLKVESRSEVSDDEREARTSLSLASFRSVIISFFINNGRSKANCNHTIKNGAEDNADDAASYANFGLPAASRARRFPRSNCDFFNSRATYCPRNLPVAQPDRATDL